MTLLALIAHSPNAALKNYWYDVIFYLFSFFIIKSILLSHATLSLRLSTVVNSLTHAALSSWMQDCISVMTFSV